ncbi:MAG: ParB/RepB/Spo0J family partition protein [Acutalibacteraceae bacterium]|nr:ParB/RepB/Spo0J family partition protein [Acutalibacteraceae bacterium]
MATKSRGLGRGIESIFDENSTDSDKIVTLNINEIEPNRNQPRKDFDEEALNSLAESISQHGLIQPIVVRPTIGGGYTIIAGERRWRACRMAGLTEIPVVIKDTDEQNLMEMALVENLQREDLNPVEEALGYKSLIDNFGLTQEEVATKMAKSRSAVANALRLLNLKEEELEALRSGKITSGHARALLSAENEEVRAKMFESALNGENVRVLEKMAKEKKTAPKRETKPTFYSEVELSIKNELHRRATVKSTGKGKGTLTIEFFSDEELEDFAKKLCK